MNKRLNCILAHIPPGKGIIDVGTDHGYLPAALAQNGYPGRIFASDLRPEPLNAARRTAQSAGLSGRIEFLLCDGLDACPREAVDTIVIAGMGGDTICGILDRAEWCMAEDYTLLLQPMTHPEVLRYWLVNNGFGLTDEDLTEDGGFLYALFSARFGGQTHLTEAELFTGSRALLRAHPLFPAQLRRQRERMETRLRGLRSAAERNGSGSEALLETMIEQIKEMQSHADG